jgi:predicted RNA methylase
VIPTPLYPHLHCLCCLLLAYRPLPPLDPSHRRTMWKKLISSKYNTPYWFCEQTGESRWEEPVEADSATAVAAAPVATAPVAAAAAAQQTADSSVSRKRSRPGDEGEEKVAPPAAPASRHEEPIVIEQNCPEHLLWKRNKLFQGFSGEAVEGLQMDEVSAFSITEADSASTMTALIYQALKAAQPGVPRTDTSVLDGMACVGGNTISFAGAFTRVLSNELDRTRYTMLQHNAKDVMKLKNVEFFNRSILDLAFERGDYDAIFLDPEWGGVNYKEHDKLLLPISDQSMEEFVLNVLRRMPRVSLIALKLPLNYDNLFIENFAKKNALNYTFITHGLKKMSLTLLTKNHKEWPK